MASFLSLIFLFFLILTFFNIFVFFFRRFGAKWIISLIDFVFHQNIFVKLGFGPIEILQKSHKNAFICIIELMIVDVIENLQAQNLLFPFIHKCLTCIEPQIIRIRTWEWNITEIFFLSELVELIIFVLARVYQFLFFGRGRHKTVTPISINH